MTSPAPGREDYPDPARAVTAAELMDTLRRYRLWAGEPSYRTMATRSGHAFAASTLHAALRRRTMPARAIVEAIITGCTRAPAHQRAFTTAWRRIRLATAAGTSAPRRDGPIAGRPGQPAGSLAH